MGNSLVSIIRPSYENQAKSFYKVIFSSTQDLNIQCKLHFPRFTSKTHFGTLSTKVFNSLGRIFSQNLKTESKILMLEFFLVFQLDQAIEQVPIGEKNSQFNFQPRKNQFKTLTAFIEFLKFKLTFKIFLRFNFCTHKRVARPKLCQNRVLYLQQFTR